MNVAVLLIRRSGCRAGQRGDAPRIACRFSVPRVAWFWARCPAASFFDERPCRRPVKSSPIIGQVFCLQSESAPQLRLPWREFDRLFAVGSMTPQKYFPRCGLVSALGKLVETHFVPALAVVRSETDVTETMKHRRQHQNASCYEFITTCQTNLRLNRRGDRDQGGFDRLASWRFNPTSCVTRYTNVVP